MSNNRAICESICYHNNHTKQEDVALLFLAVLITDNTQTRSISCHRVSPGYYATLRNIQTYQHHRLQIRILRNVTACTFEHQHSGTSLHALTLRHLYTPVIPCMSADIKTREQCQTWKAPTSRTKLARRRSGRDSRPRTRSTHASTTRTASCAVSSTSRTVR